MTGNSPTPKSYPPKGSTVNILTIDGGAMMGVIPARILAYLDGSANTQITGSGLASDIPAFVPGIASLANTTSGNTSTSPSISQLFSNFDLIVGTSTGGILTAGLAVPPINIPQYIPAVQSGYPLNAIQLLSFYFDGGTTIFPLSGSNPTWQNQDPLSATQPLFGNDGLCSVIAKIYGNPTWANEFYYDATIIAGKDIERTAHYQAINSSCSSYATLNQALTGIGITTYNGNIVNNSNTATNPWSASIDTTTPPGPIVLSNGTSDYTSKNLSVLQACLMTSAFPTLLPPVPYDLQFNPSSKTDSQSNTNFFLDGGIFAGNPALAAYLFALEMEYTINSFISIGCGTNEAAAANALTYSLTWDWGSGATATTLGNGWLYYNTPKPATSPLVDVVAGGAGQYINQMLRLIMPNSYFRLEPEIPTDEVAPAYSNNSNDWVNWVKQADTTVQTYSNWSEMIKLIQDIQR